MRHDDQHGITTARLLVYAGGIILAGLLAVAYFLDPFKGDEAPIRVKNGSFEIYLTQDTDTWESGGGNTNEPDDGDKGDHWVPSLGDANGSDGKFWIRVNADGDLSDCKNETATGRKVDVMYTSGAGIESRVTFRASKKILIVPYGRKHTRVRPRGELKLASDHHLLQYKHTDANGYISKISIKEGDTEVGSCTFKKGYTGDICVGTSSTPTYNCK